jgi:hypothetical protein
VKFGPPGVSGPRVPCEGAERASKHGTSSSRVCLLVSMTAVPGSSVHVSVRAVPDDDLVSTLLLIGPLWKSGDITVWRSGAGFVDLSPLLADALADGRIESAAILRGISEPPSRWVATKWPGALVVDAELFDRVTFAGWSKEIGHIGENDRKLAILYPCALDRRVRRNHPAGKGLGAPEGSSSGATRA